MKNKLYSCILLCYLSLGYCLADSDTVPYLYVLGIAQDAGYPQAGCYKPHCLHGWKDKELRKPVVSLGLIDPKSKKKYMFEATPNFPEQLYELEVEAPTSEYEFSEIFLTHAHIGHYTGLMFLGHESMGATQVPVFAMSKMSEFLKTNGPWSQLVSYQNIAIKPILHQQEVDLNTVKVTPFLVPHRDEYSETVGYKIQGPNKSAIFIPDINKWNIWEKSISEMIKSVDYALIDATFYANGEIPGRDMSQIPHPFVTETMQTLRHLPKSDKSKVWFIHMNHTNPLLNSESPESNHVKSEGYNIAKVGDKIEL